ncbi:hypothetical protein QWM81_10045 [Streptomyces ficellus]|uniref:Uncharacterized protein n=1 Tax=Streptomyces ficellus TaxID=1977088 RepID=A0ABT7Z4I7_9ACTN|nr:hypothetical protein [Streptomyces ficellus]MDN3294385.1 hypothetical protein [Streptomyces ficellus]
MTKRLIRAVVAVAFIAAGAVGVQGAAEAKPQDPGWTAAVKLFDPGWTVAPASSGLAENDPGWTSVGA